MCIIAIKNKGVQMPDKDIIENMWYSNPDGAGIMWTQNNRVNIAKGFMSLQSLLSYLSQLEKKVDIKSTPLVLHFRIGTHGDNIPENCHPFPVTENLSIIRKLQYHSNVAVVHNGIINIEPRKNISDTMEYIISQLAPLKQIKKDFFKDKNCHKLIYNAIQSKMCFLDASGSINLIGKFEQDNKTAMIYSNSSYKPRISYSKWDIIDNYSNLPEEDEYCPLMPLTVDMGYVISDMGKFLEADDFLINNTGTVYMYDDDFLGAVPLPNYRAVSHNNMPIDFNYEEAEFFIILDDLIY